VAAQRTAALIRPYAHRPAPLGHSDASEQKGQHGRVLGQFAVSRSGPRRQENPGLARAGSANPRFYAESGDYHPVRKRTARGQRARHGQSLNRTFSQGRDNPPRHPRFCARSRTGQGRGCQRHVAGGEAGKTRLGRFASPRRSVSRDGASSASFGRPQAGYHGAAAPAGFAVSSGPPAAPAKTRVTRRDEEELSLASCIVRYPPRAW
jgi:hypothetical protein